MKSGLPAVTFAGAVLIVAVVAVVGLLANRPGPSNDPGAPPSSPSGGPSTTPVVASAEASAEATVGPCDPAALAARITSWEGAAGQRIADVELVNRGSVACLLETRAHPQLVAGDGSVLIDGRDPATTPVLTLEPNGKVTTLISARNYCGPAPLPPVSVAFVVGDGRRMVAAPAEPTDSTVPSCLGPNQPGTIEMHPWAP